MGLIIFLIIKPTFILSQTTDLSNSNDTIKFCCVQNIFFKGNKKTKEKVVRKELLFKEKDCFPLYELTEKLQKSKENLLRLPLFNYVTINTKFLPNNGIDIEIVMEERWYIWPQFSFRYADRNFSTWLKSKDVSRLNYGAGLERYNFRGLNEKIKINFTFGYNRTFTIMYNNIFLDRSSRHGLNFFMEYKNQNQLYYQTVHNKLDYYKSSDLNAIEEFEFRFYYHFRQTLLISHFLHYSYNFIDVKDSVIQLNPEFLGNNRSRLIFDKLNYIINYDSRIPRGYPLKGTIYRFTFTKNGLFSNQLNFYTITATYKIHQKICHRLYAASEVNLKKSSKTDQPYYLNYALGFKENLQGYEYYVINGEDYGYIKSLIKFEILPTRIFNFKWIPIENFRKIHLSSYINCFGNIGYVKTKNDIYIKNNNLNNTLLYSYGIGIDFATYYDRVLRFDFSKNHLGEFGIFIHFMAPI